MLKTIDLFSGAGGLSLGFQQTGEFQIIAAAEINKAARETYKANIASNVTNFVFINEVDKLVELILLLEVHHAKVFQMQIDRKTM